MAGFQVSINGRFWVFTEAMAWQARRGSRAELPRPFCTIARR
jgi:hypothetical protein